MPTERGRGRVQTRPRRSRVKLARASRRRLIIHKVKTKEGRREAVLPFETLKHLKCANSGYSSSVMHRATSQLTFPRRGSLVLGCGGDPTLHEPSGRTSVIGTRH